MLTLRRSARFGMMMAAGASASLASNSAYAASTSIGSAALEFGYDQGLDTSIDTGFIGVDPVHVRAILRIDPVAGGGPLYSVKMPKGAVVQATWAGDKKIVLKAANGSQNDGVVTVRHTLTPSLEVKVDFLIFHGTFPIDTNTLVNQIPGAKFAYDSTATQSFAPWGFTQVDTTLNAPDLDKSVLFSQPLPGIFEPNQWKGSIGLRATTTPTFSYKTTRVVLSGSDTPLTETTGEITVDAVDGDYLELTAQVQGAMNVTGAMDVQPFVSFSKMFGFPIGSNANIGAVSVPYTVPPADVWYQAALVHIPLPNVHGPEHGIDLGNVKSGGSATKTVPIENSGEMPATLTVASSSPQFSVPGGTITIAPKARYDLVVKFASSDKSGPARSDITILSNDPDSPRIAFQIGANGAEVGDSESAPGSSSTSKVTDSGCGCKTAGTPVSTNTWASMGFVAVILAFLARRRVRVV